MLHSHTHCRHHHHLFPNLPIPLSLSLNHHNINPSLSLPSSSPPLLVPFFHKPTILHSVSAIPPATSPWLTQLAELTNTATEEGPIELPFSTPSIFATTDDPSPLQVATSLLLTGAISVFLFRAVRRRTKRAKELKFRSSGAKSLKEEAVDSLKAMGSTPIEDKGPPSPVQAFLGAISAGIITLILFKFTTTIEAALNRQTVSDNFSVRQITITIRTIVNGLCYLATFVFGINSIGLFLYSGQLAINSFMEGSTEKETETKSTEKSGLSNSSVESSTDGTQLSSTNEDQSSNDAQ